MSVLCKCIDDSTREVLQDIQVFEIDNNMNTSNWNIERIFESKEVESVNKEWHSVNFVVMDIYIIFYLS